MQLAAEVRPIKILGYDRSEQAAERAARVVHEVEQRLGDDAEEERRRPSEDRDEDDLGLRTLEYVDLRSSHPPSRAGHP